MLARMLAHKLVLSKTLLNLLWRLLVEPRRYAHNILVHNKGKGMDINPEGVVEDDGGKKKQKTLV